MQIHSIIKKFLISLFLGFFSLACFSKTHVVSVGIDRYASSDMGELWHTAKDAKKISSFYVKSKADVVTLTNNNASKANILNALRQKFLDVNPNDKIIFFFSGHGFEGGFIPYDAYSYDTQLFYEELIDIMQKSPAKEKYIFANACHSGTFRSNKLFTQPQFGNILFFLSSRAGEVSWDVSNLDECIFTHYLLKALRGSADANRDKKITARELFEYVSTQVEKESDGLQHPVMWGNFPDNLVIVEYKK